MIKGNNLLIFFSCGFKLLKTECNNILSTLTLFIDLSTKKKLKLKFTNLKI